MGAAEIGTLLGCVTATLGIFALAIVTYGRRL